MNLECPPRPGRAASLAILAALTLGGPALAAPPEGVTLTDQWIRMIVPARPAAAYFTLDNESDQAVSLTGASSPGCSSAMLHESVSENGSESMKMVMKVEVPAHGSLSFAPGGYHVMCMQPDMEVGSEVPVTLTFSDGSEITGDFPVKNAAGQ